MTLYTDDDLERGARALDPSAWDDAESRWGHIRFEHYQTADKVLDAVLPAYRTRLLNELADFVDKWGISGVIGNTYVINFLRHMGEEECPDCGMRGLHAADHNWAWPEETP